MAAYEWLREPIMADPNTLRAGSTTHATAAEVSANLSLSNSKAVTASATVAIDKGNVIARPFGASRR